MLIARRLARENRAEYVLYLFQVEDLLRAYGLDADRIRGDYVSRFSVSPLLRQTIGGWYAGLCDQMRQEGVQLQGHVSLTRDALNELEELHRQLLRDDSSATDYKTLYRKALPLIVDLRGRQGGHPLSEVETCLDALYGVMLLRLQKREVSPETAEAANTLATLMGTLSEYFKKERPFADSAADSLAGDDEAGEAGEETPVEP